MSIVKLFIYLFLLIVLNNCNNYHILLKCTFIFSAIINVNISVLVYFLFIMYIFIYIYIYSNVSYFCYHVLYILFVTNTIGNTEFTIQTPP